MQHQHKPPSENLYQVVPVSPEEDPNKACSTAIPMLQPQSSPISETGSPPIASERGTHLHDARKMRAINPIHHAIADDFPYRNQHQSGQDNPSKQKKSGPKPPISRPKPKSQLGKTIKGLFKSFISSTWTRKVSILLIYCSFPLTLAFGIMLIVDFNEILDLNPSAFHRSHAQDARSELLLKALDGLSYMAFNLDLHPILDLKVTGTTCPAGYDPINLGKWSGTTRACSCPSYVVGGWCNYYDDSDYDVRVDSSECQDIPGVGAVDLLEWDETIFCAQRAQLDRDYVRRASCPPGYRTCSEGICLENSLLCPITSISITSTSLDSSSVPLVTNTKFLTAYRTLGEAPLVNLKISLNSVPCYSSYTYTPAGGGDYEPLNQRPLGCNGYGADLFSSSVDQMTETSVLTTNNAPSAVFNLPGYRPVLDSTPTVLAAQKRLRVATRDECLRSDFVMMTTAAFDALINKPLSDKGGVYGTLIPSMILSGGLIFFGLLPVILSFCCPEATDMASCREPYVKCTLTVYYCVGFGVLICICVLFGLVLSNNHLYGSVEDLLTLHNIGCFQGNQPEMQIMTDFNNVAANYYVSYASNIEKDATVLFAVNLFVYIQAIIIRAHSKLESC